MHVLTDTQEMDLAIAPKTKRENPAAVDGVPVWGSSNPEIGTVTPAADGLSAVAKATGVLGTFQVTCVADVRLGSEVKEITGVEDFEVKAGEAVSLGLVAGPAREQAEPAPEPEEPPIE
jgi:hypothetical protein